MELIENWIATLPRFIPFLATLAVTTAGLSFLNVFLKRRWKDQPDAQFRFQLIMLVLTLAAILALILALPLEDSLRSELLGLLGILLSAAIALSSTTFIGNIMASFMLKAVRSARPGDFITIGDLTGRITEMDLLHTQIQTEFRDLVTVPNLYMVTQPLQVVRASGTIIHTEISLGYDVHHQRVTEALLEAAEQAGLKEAFVHVRELGDFSVSYRVAGLLENVDSLISARAALRRAALDALHGAGIEIVSPSFMNTRSLAADRLFVPGEKPPQAGKRAKPPGPDVAAEEVAFDVAKVAARGEELRRQLAELERELKEATGLTAEAKERIKAEQSRLAEQLAALEAQQQKAENERGAADA